MSDEKALLAAIWQHPQEDTPRLVYADWLQETGRPADAARAEFIRLQCELARLDAWDERRPALERREKKLWKQFEKAWRAGLRAALREAPFRRGFVAPEFRRVTTRQFCDLPASAFDAAPGWNYHLHGPPADLAELAGCVHLRRLDRLQFWFNPSAEEASGVLRSPHLGNVRVLSLGYGDRMGKALAALAANPAAESLSELDVHDGFDNAAAAVLGSSPAFAKLRAFETYSHTLTTKGLRAIFNSRHLANLTELTLPAWYGEPGAKAIAGTRPAFRLRKLNMFGARMPDNGAALVANWPGLASVRSFTIGGFCEILGPRALAASPHARNLRELDLTLSHLSRAGALALARSKTLDLMRLVIRSTPAAEDDTAVAALVKRFGKDAVKVRHAGQRKRS